MSFRLPPLKTLRFFEAAARHLSFKRASEELHVTPSAVSHGLQALESWLRVRLFRRGPQGLSLTAAGRAYFPHVRSALAGLAEATERLPGRKARGTLSVSVAPTFASHWLVPRLPRFAAHHPDIVLNINTAQRQVNFPQDGFDLAIRMAQTARARGTWIRLVPESFVPVCSPAFARRLGNGTDLEALAHAPLIYVTTVSEDWAAWFARFGVEPRALEQALCFDTINMAFEAAAQGLGIALGRKPLIDHYVASGRLVELCPPPLPGDTGYWLVGTEATFDRPEVNQFRRWVLEELGQGRRD